MKKKTEKGFALVLSIVLLLVMSLMGGSLIVISAGDHQSNNTSDEYQQTFYVAETALLEAEKIIRKLIAVNPHIPQSYFALSQILFENRKFQELVNANFELSVDAAEIDERLGGLKWITPLFKENPKEEVLLLKEIKELEKGISIQYVRE